jgi:hypothetical protein
MAILDIVDRVPSQPNRFKITKADGTSEYVTLERADEPTQVGTPINKELLDKMTMAENISVSSTLATLLGGGVSSVEAAFYQVTPKFTSNVYAGDGTYGASNPTVLRFKKKPNFILFTGSYNHETSIKYINSVPPSGGLIIRVSLISDEINFKIPFGANQSQTLHIKVYTDTSYANPVAVSFYSTEDASYQLNSENVTYSYVAFY